MKYTFAFSILGALFVLLPIAQIEAQTLGEILRAVEKRQQLPNSFTNETPADPIQWVEGGGSDSDIDGKSFQDKVSLLNQANREVKKLTGKFLEKRNISSNGGGLLMSGSSSRRLSERSGYLDQMRRLSCVISYMDTVEDDRIVKKEDLFQGWAFGSDSVPANPLKAGQENDLGDDYQLFWSWRGRGDAEPNDPPDQANYHQVWNYLGEAGGFKNTVNVKGSSVAGGEYRVFSVFPYGSLMFDSLDIQSPFGGTAHLSTPVNQCVARGSVSKSGQAAVSFPEKVSDKIVDLNVPGTWETHDYNGDSFIDGDHYVPSFGLHQSADLWKTIYDPSDYDPNDADTQSAWDASRVFCNETSFHVLEFSGGTDVYLNCAQVFAADFNHDLSGVETNIPERPPNLEFRSELENNILSIPLANEPGNECELVWAFPNILLPPAPPDDQPPLERALDPLQGYGGGGAAIAAMNVLKVRGSGKWQAIYSGSSSDREPEVKWGADLFSEKLRWPNFFAYLHDYWQPVLKQLVCATYGVKISEPSALGYTIEIYRRGQVTGPNAIGEYTFGGDPMKTYVVTTPSQGTEDTGKMTITSPSEVVSLSLEQTRHTEEGRDYIDSDWTMTIADGQHAYTDKELHVEAARYNSSNVISQPFTVEDSTKCDGVSLPATTTTYQDSWANPDRIKQISEAGGRTTDFTYDEKTDDDQSKFYLLSKVVQSGGPAPYEVDYNEAELPTHWKSGKWEVATSYSGNDVTRTTTYDEGIVRKETTKYSPDMTTETTTVTGAEDVKRVVERYPGTDAINPWGLKRVRDYDGSLTTYSYAWSGTNFVTTVSTGKGSDTDTSVAAGTRTETTVNAAGYVISTKVYDIEANALIASSIGSGTPYPTSFTHLFGPAESYSYDDLGRVKTYTDQMGKTSTYTRDGLGRITKMERGSLTWDITYNPGHLGRKITGSQGRSWEETTDAFGAHQTLAIAGPENITVARDETSDSITTTTTNATTHRNKTQVVSKTSPFKVTITGNAVEPSQAIYTFANGWVVNTTSDASSALYETTTYDALGRLKKQVVPNGLGAATKSWLYKDGFLNSYNDGAGVTLYEYRGDGSLKKASRGDRFVRCDRTSSSPAGITREWKNAAGDTFWKQIYRPASGVVEDYSWGKNERMVKTTPTLAGGVLSLAMAGASGTGISGALSWKDGAPDAGSITSGPYSHSWSATADDFGVVTQVKINPGAQTANQFHVDFSALGLPTGASGIEGLASTSFGGTPFDGSGNLSLTATRSGHDFSQAYSAKGDLVSAGGYGQVDQAWSAPTMGATISRSLTPAGGIISPSTFQWNPSGQLTDRQFAGGGSESFTFNSSGALQTWKNARNVTIGFSPNTFGEPTTIGTIASGIIYDKAGRLKSVTDVAGTHERTYVTGELDVESHTGGPLGGQSVDRDYDAQGRLTKVTANGIRVSSYSYDGTGKLTSITTAAGRQGTYSSHDAVTGKPKSLQFGSTLAAVTGIDGLGRTTGQASSTPGGTYGYGYTYNADGLCNGVTGGSGNWTLGYDAKGFLSTATRVGGPSLSYSFDAAGRFHGNGGGFAPGTRPNSTTTTVMGSVAPGATVTINGVQLSGASINPTTGIFSQSYTGASGWQTYDVIGTLAGAGHNGTAAKAEQIRQIFVPSANEMLLYDGGNRSQDERWDYTWNDLDQLTAAVVHSTPPGVAATRIDFKYDWQGRRLEKKVSQGGQVLKRTTYLYDGWRPVVETEFDGNGYPTLKRIYTWGADVSGTFEGAGGIGGLVEVKETRGTISTSSYAINDGVGNVIGLVDETGARVATYDMGPFGEVLSVSGTRAASCPLRYQTKYYDEDLGLVYFGKRWYDPKTKSWVNRDPLREAGGINLYEYCNNQPVGNYDAIGLSIRMDLYGWESDDFDPKPSWHAAREQDQALATIPLDVFQAAQRTSDEETAYQNSFEFKVPEMAGAYQHLAVGTVLAIPQGVLEATTEVDLTESLLSGNWEYGDRKWGMAAVAMDFTPFGEVFGAARTPLRTAVGGELGLTLKTAGAEALPEVVWNNGWRTADGKFARPLGAGLAGAEAEQLVWDAIKQKPSWNVIEGRVSVRNAAGDLRVYDGAAVSPRGRIIGLEVKSGGGTLSLSQSAFDAGINTFNPAIGVGKSQGLQIGRSLLINIP